MNIGHNQVAITNPSDAFILNCASMDGTTLSKMVVITNFQTGGLALVFLVLTILTNGSKLEDTVTLADFSGALNAGMGVYYCARVNSDTRTDIGEWPNLHIRGQLSFWINDCLWVDQLQILFSTGYIRYSDFLTINRRHSMELPNSTLAGLDGSPNRQCTNSISYC